MQNVNNICNFFSSRFANKKIFAFQLFAVTCLLAFFLTYRMSKKSFHQEFNLVKTSECQGVRTPDWCSHRGQCHDQTRLSEATLSPCPSCCYLPPTSHLRNEYFYTASLLYPLFLGYILKITEVSSLSGSICVWDGNCPLSPVPRHFKIPKTGPWCWIATGHH